MTARYLLSGLCFAAAICAAIAGLMSYDPAFQADFKHFAYRPLVQAESALEKGEYSKSLDLYKIAITRAARCGKKGVTARIKSRILEEGLTLTGKNVPDGWGFLEYYALVSDNFEVSSSVIENWCLSHAAAPMRFRYCIKRMNDPYTVWGSKLIRVPNFIYAVFYDFFPNDEQERKNQRVSYVQGLCKTWRAPAMVKCPKGIRSTKILIKGLKANQKIFVETGKAKFDLSNFTREPDGTLTSTLAYNRGSATIWQIVAQCKYGDNLNFEIELVKEYEQL